VLKKFRFGSIPAIVVSPRDITKPEGPSPKSPKASYELVVHVRTGHNRKKEREKTAADYFHVKIKSHVSVKEKQQATSIYVHTYLWDIGCSDNSEKNIWTTSSARSLTAACNAQGLVAAHSRKLLATLGGSTSTRP
jgi:hypothetical protein